MTKSLLLSFCILSLLTSIANAQQAQCTTIEQCRLLVDVVRAQLQTAQDMWSYWADQTAIVRGKLAEEKKKSEQLEKNEKGKVDEEAPVPNNN